MAYAMLKAYPCQYLVFDIPPSLAISQWYLSQVFAGRRIFRFRTPRLAPSLAGKPVD